jgi:hypothetical protein
MNEVTLKIKLRDASEVMLSTSWGEAEMSIKIDRGRLIDIILSTVGHGPVLDAITEDTVREWFGIEERQA